MKKGVIGVALKYIQSLTNAQLVPTALVALVMDILVLSLIALAGILLVIVATVVPSILAIRTSGVLILIASSL